ncbi:TPA: hypothetical protein NV714_002703 [Escherichia coli]|nr:hypothetical protein [Escherichia coli]
MDITLYSNTGSAVLVNVKYILLSLLWLGVYCLFLNKVNNKIREKIGFNSKFDKKNLFLPYIMTGATILITLMGATLGRLNSSSVVISATYFYSLLFATGILFIALFIMVLFDKFYKKEKTNEGLIEALIFSLGLFIISLISNDLWQYKEHEIEVKDFKIVYVEPTKMMIDNENIILLNGKSYKLPSIIDLKPGDIIKMGRYKNANYICTGKKFNICYQAKESEDLNKYK